AFDAERETGLASALEAVREGRNLDYAGWSSGLGEDVQRMIIPVRIGETGQTWSVLVTVPMSSLLVASNTIVAWIVGVGLVLLVMVSAALYIVGQRVIRRPVEHTRGHIQSLIDGNYSVEIDTARRADEIGRIGKALEVFRDQAARAEELSAEQEKEQRRRLARAEAVARLTADFDASVAQLLQSVSDSVVNLNTAAGELTGAAEDTSHQSTAVAAASEEASSNVGTVAAAAEELSASVSEISRQVRSSADIAESAAFDAERETGLASALEAVREGRNLDYAGWSSGLGEDVQRMIIPVRIGETGQTWSVLVTVPMSSLLVASNTIVAWIVGVGLVLLVMVSAALYIVGQRVIRRPVEHTRGHIQSLIDGNYSVEIDTARRADEIGRIGKALEVFRDQAARAEELSAEQEKEQRRRLARAEAVARLTADFDASVAQLLQSVSDSVVNLNTAAGELTGAAEDTSHQSTAVAAASEEASSNVGTVAAAAEELSASVSEISRQVRSSADIAESA
ncbi:Methyl-accepting chemotaxis protein Amb2333, partial [Durusdinium trenchii]